MCSQLALCSNGSAVTSAAVCLCVGYSLSYCLTSDHQCSANVTELKGKQPGNS